ncbi:putative mitochondrial protein, partial [Mucuna pruriens]
MIVIGDDEIEKLTLKKKLVATQFEMKELGKLKYFLEIEVEYLKQGIFISQRKYVLDLLKETGKLGCKTSGVLIEQNLRIECEESPTIEKSQYQILMGKLIYLSHTRPNIAYILGKRLLFRKEGTLSMKIYTNADYAGSIVDRRSTFRYCKFLGGNLVTWRSKKQNVGRIKFFCDNNSAISIAHNLVQHDRVKYIEIDRHFIKEKLDGGLIATTYGSKWQMFSPNDPLQLDFRNSMEG